MWKNFRCIIKSCGLIFSMRNRRGSPGLYRDIHFARCDTCHYSGYFGWAGSTTTFMSRSMIRFVISAALVKLAVPRHKCRGTCCWGRQRRDINAGNVIIVDGDRRGDPPVAPTPRVASGMISPPIPKIGPRTNFIFTTHEISPRNTTPAVLKQTPSLCMLPADSSHHHNS